MQNILLSGWEYLVEKQLKLVALKVYGEISVVAMQQATRCLYSKLRALELAELQEDSASVKILENQILDIIGLVVTNAVVVPNSQDSNIINVNTIIEGGPILGLDGCRFIKTINAETSFVITKTEHQINKVGSITILDSAYNVINTNINFAINNENILITSNTPLTGYIVIASSGCGSGGSTESDGKVFVWNASDAEAGTYNTDVLVSYNGVLYRSLIEDNIVEPSLVTPESWEPQSIQDLSSIIELINSIIEDPISQDFINSLPTIDTEAELAVHPIEVNRLYKTSTGFLKIKLSAPVGYELIFYTNNTNEEYIYASIDGGPTIHQPFNEIFECNEVGVIYFFDGEINYQLLALLDLVTKELYLTSVNINTTIPLILSNPSRIFAGDPMYHNWSDSGSGLSGQITMGVTNASTELVEISNLGGSYQIPVNACERTVDQLRFEVRRITVDYAKYLWAEEAPVDDFIFISVSGCKVAIIDINKDNGQIEHVIEDLLPGIPKIINPAQTPLGFTSTAMRFLIFYDND